MTHLEPGDGGAAILDTVNYGVTLLESEPKEFRRVLLLISEERDHGSKHTKPVELIKHDRRVGCAGAEREFFAGAGGVGARCEDNGEERTMNMVSALVMALKAFKKNVAKEVATESGGEYTTFVGDKRFEARVMTAARDARNRYLITFSPSDPTPGLHTIRVRTAQDYGARIVARANYWADAGNN